MRFVWGLIIRFWRQRHIRQAYRTPEVPANFVPPSASLRTVKRSGVCPWCHGAGRGPCPFPGCPDGESHGGPVCHVCKGQGKVVTR